MCEKIRITAPFSEETACRLRAGDSVLITGVVYTGRDAAHRRFDDLLRQGKPLPVDLRDQILYYVGPTPAPADRPIGAAGPTTSGRMDAYTPRLLCETGLRAMIGKGFRSPAVIEAIRVCHAVYFAAIGGAGALLASSVRACSVAAYPELQSEAVHRLEVVDFPAVVVIDAEGNNLYESGPAAYLSRRG